MREKLLQIAVATSLGVALAASPAADAQVNPGQERAEAAGLNLIGSAAPRFVLETIDGEAIDLGELYGEKAVYLKFWATWCVPCRRQMPHFENVYQTAGDDLAVIAVNAGLNDSLDDIESFRREYGITMPIVIDDGRLAEALNLRITPQHVVIGSHGRIDYVSFFADERLDAALRAARTCGPSEELERAASMPNGSVRRAAADRLPDLSATTLDGGTFGTRDGSDPRPTVYVFMSSWCESYLANQRPAMGETCRQVREQIDALAPSHARVRWLGVATGVWATEAQVREYATEHSVPIPLTFDETGEWFRSFRVTSFPTIVIADAEGNIVKRIAGFDRNLSVELEGL